MGQLVPLICYNKSMGKRNIARIKIKSRSKSEFYIDVPDIEYLAMPDWMIDRDGTGTYTSVYEDPVEGTSWYDERIETARG